MPSACAMSRIDVAAYPWRANSSARDVEDLARRFTAAFTALASRSRISCTTNERSLASRTQRALSSVAGGRVPEIKLEDMETREGFMRSRKPEHVTLLPDPPRGAPPPADHLHRRPPRGTAGHVRGPDAGEVRRPGAAGRGPRRSSQAWLFDGKVNPKIGLAAVAGRPIEECSYEPVRFDEMRRGDVGRRRARARHGHRRRVRVGELPLGARPGSAVTACQLGVSDPELALAVDAAR